MSAKNCWAAFSTRGRVWQRWTPSRWKKALSAPQWAPSIFPWVRFGGAGSAAGGGVGKSVSDLTGTAAVQAWNKGISTRYQTAMQQAQAALAKMPYPPVTQ